MVKVKFICIALLAFEAVLSSIIVLKAGYTEIDWIAYMQQVDGYVHGERDYTKLRGSTGPLVYPAGFLYVYRAFYAFVGGLEGGASQEGIALIQWAFVGLYIVTQAVVFAVYAAFKTISPWVYVTLCLSKRMHSVFMLRLFNDPVAMLFAYVSVLLFQRRKWVIGSVLFSLGVSVKMNVLLMLPGLLVLLVGGTSFGTTVFALATMVGVQVALGAPFLLTYPWEYFGQAFEFGRVFDQRFSMNYQFVSNDVFTSKTFAGVLLLAHLVTLIALAHWRWCKRYGGFFGFICDIFRRALGGNLDGAQSSFTPEYVTQVFFESNLVGIVFARSLHFQFYSWFYHTLPFLLWSNSRLPVVGKVVFMLAIEWCWNIFPCTPESSAFFVAVHFCLLLFVVLTPLTPVRTKNHSL